MPQLITQAIVCAARAHGEHGVIARLLTPDAGLVSGYVRGGRSRAQRPVLVPGNIVHAELRARTDAQMAGLTLELVHSRAPLLAEPLPAAAIEWACALTASALPEEHPYPALHLALSALFDAVEGAPAARGWAVALVQYERLVLAELGFGLDLGECAVTGTEADLLYVSPTSGRAVSREGALGYEARLLPLPPFLTNRADGPADTDLPQILDGLRLTGHFIARELLDGRRATILASRERLIERLKRAIA